MKKIKRGDRAPNFAGIDQYGNLVTLEQFEGNVAIVFFYPNDCFSGCTAGECALRDNFKTWGEKGYKIIGVCRNNFGLHKEYIHKHSIPITLIEDRNDQIVVKYEIWGSTEGSNLVHHTTFVISEYGYIGQIITNANKYEHANQIEYRLSENKY